jgi:hypothetical protein
MRSSRNLRLKYVELGNTLICSVGIAAMEVYLNET